MASSLDRSISRIDPATNRVASRLRLMDVPHDVAVGAGGVWITTSAPDPVISQGSIGIGVLSDCDGPFRIFYDDSLAGAELPLVQRSGRPAGPHLTDGIDGARAGEKPVRLAFGCTDGTTASAIREARRLVEDVGVRVLIGPLKSGDEEDAVIDYARLRPDVAFVNGVASSQELDPPANFFTFHADGAQWMAGLGTYAYRTLGWRRGR